MGASVPAKQAVRAAVEPVPLIRTSAAVVLSTHSAGASMLTDTAACIRFGIP